MRTAIRAERLQKWFGDGDARTFAVRDVSFDVEFGEMLFIVGPSGSGKTTLLSMISGVLRPNEGVVSIEGTNLWGLSDDEIADIRLNRIGFVFQDYHLFPRLTTAENVAIPLILRREPWKASVATAMGYLKIVGLETKSELPPLKLSGGEQQRVAIARAMIGKPDILILDEPTASLDGDTGRGIVSFIKSDLLNEKRTIVIVTHDTRIYEFADRVIHMEDGKITRIIKGEARA